MKSKINHKTGYIKLRVHIYLRIVCINVITFRLEQTNKRKSKTAKNVQLLLSLRKRLI